MSRRVREERGWRGGEVEGREGGGEGRKDGEVGCGLVSEVAAGSLEFDEDSSIRFDEPSLS
jgi:hypothetical protein